MCYFHSFLDVFWALFFCSFFWYHQPFQEPSGPNWFLSTPVRLFFPRVFSLIWTMWVWTKSCWGPFGKAFGPIWTIGTFPPSQQKRFQKPTKPICFLIDFLRPLFQPLFWPIWTFGLCIKSCWGPFWKVSGAKKIFGPSVPFQHEFLPKATWTNLVFIRFFSNPLPTPILVYLGLLDLYRIVLGVLRKVIWTKKKN